MSVKIFLSTVSNEFRAYRDQLRTDLTRHNVEVKVQEDFKNLGGDTLDMLDVYSAHCDAVVHLAGDMTGADPGDGERSTLLAKYPDLADKLPALGEAVKNDTYAMGGMARARSRQVLAYSESHGDCRTRTELCTDGRLHAAQATVEKLLARRSEE